MHFALAVGAHRAEMGLHMTRCMVVPTTSIHVWTPTMAHSVTLHGMESLRRRSSRATEMRVTLSAQTQSTPSATTSGPMVQGSGTKPSIPRP